MTVFMRTGLVLLSLLTLAIFSAGDERGQSSAQAATPINESTSARDAATSREDIKLTNSCIEAGQAKEHCVCVTKIFKHDMSLREYLAAIKLYTTSKSDDPTRNSAAKLSLRQIGYNEQEITMIDGLQRRLSNISGLEKRCAVATAYFDQEER